MNILTAVIELLYTIAVLVTVFLQYETTLTLLTISVFVCLGFGFIIAGIKMIFTISVHFTDFHQKVSCLLWLATMLLAIPMFIRAVNWAFLTANPTYMKWYNE